jgi:hypothetical protein
MSVPHTQHEYINRIIPYRMNAAAVLNLALRYVRQWDSPRKLEIYFDEKLSNRGLSTAFTNPAIEAGVMHCRALLEFIGLKCDGKNPNKLVQRGSGRADDFVIEDFSGTNGKLQRVSVQAALAAYAGSAEEAEKSLATVIRCANKGMPTQQPVTQSEGTICITSRLPVAASQLCW